MLNNDDQKQLDNLKSQIQILYKRIQNFIAEINEIMHREEGDITYQKVEELTARVMNYRERVKKIEQAITLMMKIRAEKEAEERRKSEAEQREKAAQERKRAEQEAREKAKKEKLKQEIATKWYLREKKAEEQVKQGIDEEITVKEAASREQNSEQKNRIEQIKPQPELYPSYAEDVEEQITFGSAVDRVLFEQASSKLYDKRKEVRCESVREIEKLGYKSKVFIPTLVKMLEDREGDVRV